jgi:uncharacterized repeat protein (TIGR01451 family)
MKRLLLVVLIAGMVMVVSAGAYADVANYASGNYRSMGGFLYPDTITSTVNAALVGPIVSLTKSQTNVRTSQSGGAIMVSNGDSIWYQIMFQNNGSDSATDLVVTDTLAFVVIGGQTVSYVLSSATDSGAVIAGGKVAKMEYYNGATWQGTTSSTMLANTLGVRWTIDLVGAAGSGKNTGTLNFNVKITIP